MSLPVGGAVSISAALMASVWSSPDCGSCVEFCPKAGESAEVSANTVVARATAAAILDTGLPHGALACALTACCFDNSLTKDKFMELRSMFQSIVTRSLQYAHITQQVADQ